MRQEPDFTLEELTGRVRDHVREVDSGRPSRCTLHRDVAGSYLAMRAAAATDGIDLVAFSGFRDFDRQLAIWNGKFRGERPMLDRAGQPLDAQSLSPAERVTAILWWSALPGASRHHWGTDFDVLDAAALSPGYKLQVVPSEYEADGPFAHLTAWLDDHMHAYGFFRPYATDRGGVSPEPWHLSHAPVAARARSAFGVEGLRAVLSGAPIEGRDAVLESLDGCFERYVLNVDTPPDLALASPAIR